MSHSQLKIDWKKRVRQEYFRLRQQKKFERSDKIKTAFANNLKSISEKLNQLEAQSSNVTAQPISIDGSFDLNPMTK